MYLYIEIVDVVANAFVELLKIKNNSERQILFSELDSYGAKVVEILNKDKDIHAVYVVSQESQYSICADYSAFFEEYENENGERGIKLREGITSIDIWKQFCAALSLKVLMAFREVSL